MFPIFQAGEHKVNFIDYKQLYKAEENQLKVVPKLTSNVNPSNLQKMNVRLATQVCSY